MFVSEKYIYHLNTTAKAKVIDGIKLVVADARVGELYCNPAKYSVLPNTDLK